MRSTTSLTPRPLTTSSGSSRPLSTPTNRLAAHPGDGTQAVRVADPLDDLEEGQLAGRATGPADQPAADDDAGAESLAGEDEHDVVDTVGDTVPAFGQRGEVGVGAVRGPPLDARSTVRRPVRWDHSLGGKTRLRAED